MQFGPLLKTMISVSPRATDIPLFTPLNTQLQINMVSEEPLSIVAPCHAQSHVEGLLTREIHQSPVLQPGRQAHSDQCSTVGQTLTSKQQAAVMESYYSKQLQYAPAWQRRWPHCVC